MPRFDTTPFAADLPKHNLPAQTTPFVGREAELAELSKLLNNSSVRLITILAQGGMGKTRLALEIATQFAGSSDTTPTTQMRRVFPNGVYFVELAPLNAADAIAGAIAIATGYQLQNEMGDARQQVLEFLREKTLLLIMDNFEHLIDGAGIVADILHNAPHVKIIATSRQRLNQTGETLFNLAGMDFPEWETPENALEYSAVKLFMQSARRARPSFELHADDLQYVARICRMVDGLPLGILLAAAWLEMLSPKEISTEIARSLDFLESHMSDIPERQRSIRAVFDYSWNLMTPEEQVAFMQLAVFQGGFTREAAQEVAGANLRVLMSLMNKSLIRRDADSGRYDIHELLRQYAEAKLRQAGIEEQTHDAHSHYFAAFLAQREADIKGRRQLAALEEVDADFTNVRAMWQRIVTQKQGELVSAAMESLRLFCDMRGRTSEGTELFSLARENFPQDEFPLIWSLLTVCWGWMIVFGGQLNRSKVESPLYESLESLRSHQHHIGTALCLEVLGLYYFNPDTFEKSRPLFEECIAILRPLNESSLMGGPMAMLANFQSTPEDIAAVQQQSLELSRAAGNINEMAWTLMNVGMHHLVRGLLDEAEAHWHESLALHRARKARNGVVFISTILSYGAFYKGDLDTAKTMNAEVMKMSSEYMYLIGVKSTLALFALIHAINGDYERCRHDAEEALAIGNVGFESLSLPVAHIALAVSEYALNDVRATKQHYTVAYNIQFMTPYLRTSLLPICALIHSMEGAHERAVECLALAFQQPPATMGWMQKWALLEQLRADFEQKLGKEGYNAAWERGKTLDIEIVIRELAAESKS